MRILLSQYSDKGDTYVAILEIAFKDKRYNLNWEKFIQLVSGPRFENVEVNVIHLIKAIYNAGLSPKIGDVYFKIEDFYPKIEDVYRVLLANKFSEDKIHEGNSEIKRCERIHF